MFAKYVIQCIILPILSILKVSTSHGVYLSISNSYVFHYNFVRRTQKLNGYEDKVLMPYLFIQS